MLSKPLPRFVIAKRLTSGATGFYFNIPTLYRKLGCTISNEPLGTDYTTACGEAGDGGRAAALNALFDGSAAAGLDATIALLLGDERFQIRIAAGKLAVARGEIANPDATLETDQTTLLSLLRTDCSLDDALATGNLRLAGNRVVIETFRRLFPLPPPIPTAELTS